MKTMEEKIIMDAVEKNDVYEIVQVAKASDKNLYLIISMLCKKAGKLQHIKNLLNAE